MSALFLGALAVGVEQGLDFRERVNIDEGFVPSGLLDTAPGDESDVERVVEERVDVALVERFGRTLQGRPCRQAFGFEGFDFLVGCRGGRRPVIGHSYGSLVVGKAAARGMNSDVDNVVFVGSPGVGVGDPEDLGPYNGGAFNVWVGEAPSDPIADLGRFGGDPGDWADNQFTVSGDGCRSSIGGSISWGPIDVSGSQTIPSMSAHSCYFNAGTTSLVNMARIGTGVMPS